MWLGELTPNVDLVVPFDERSHNLGKSHREIMDGYKTGHGTRALYMRAALQAHVIHQVTQRLVPPNKYELMRDSQGMASLTMH